MGRVPQRACPGPRDGADPVATAIAEQGPALLDRLSGDLADPVLLVGRVLGGRPAATAARVVAIDRRRHTSHQDDPDDTDEPNSDAVGT